MLAASQAAVPLSEQSPAELRRAFSALVAVGARAEVASARDRWIPGPGGDIPVRIYVPASDHPHTWGRRRGALVWFHGGGWMVGGLELADGTSRALANAAGVVVVSVDYRLAPEHPFPAALEDALAAVRWTAANAADLGIARDRIAVGGDSAGGNLAAVACQQLRGSGPSVRFQLLVYPVTDARLSSRSMDENAEGYFLTRAAMARFLDQYLGGADRDDPRVSPLRAPHEALIGLPPGLVVTAEYDPLRDEGEAYAERLQAAGVDCAVSRYRRMIHGFFSMGGVVPAGSVAVDRAAAALVAALE